MMKTIRVALAAALCLSSLSVQADIFGTLSGRSADPANNPQFSVEGSFTTSGDYQNIGARVNYGVNDALSVYGDFGITEFGGFGSAPDGNSFGAGLFYHLPNLSSASADYDFAVQGSFHVAGLETAGIDFDYTALAANLLVSPKTALNPESGLNWYANAGFTRLAVDIGFPANEFGFDFGGSDSSFELQLGGGIYMPMGPGTLYAGADLIDEFIFGAGYRYGFN